MKLKSCPFWIKLMIKYFALLLLLVPTSQASEWTDTNTALEVAFYTTHIIDWQQTLEISRNPNYIESNPILGKYPTEQEVNQYFLVTGILHYVIARYLDNEYRTVFQVTTLLISYNAITNNASIGIKIRF